MKIGIVGAGSIGCYVGGAPTRVPPEQIDFATAIDALADRDAILCCVKSAQTEEVARELARVVPKAVVASLQNGVRNPVVLRAAGLTTIAAIVSFNVVSRGNGRFHRATSGPLMLEAAPDHPLVRALRAADLEIETHADLAPHQWTKLVINLNNAVSALSGAPTRDILLSPGYRRVLAAVVGEALDILRESGIRPAKLRGLPITLMPTVLRLPTPLVRLVTRSQVKVDPEARSSMWEDLSRGRPTEVDYLNGEIVRLAERAGRTAPLNRRMVELVHQAERTAPGSPNLDAVTLWSELVR